ncbi:hypothetical protein E3P81_01210 [Wallemia ichthyophaga]|nr:hypothetical protein E3P97_01211 [Wallemia ichthyophaga]TIB34233.1 hypothetical protein E3P85_00960 [Wallemia ichthyophaga]TIB48510.1 hypothetical protein E3P82_01209 [Wallemia ichthyophaga]TIB52554.1 hypothetical protein E3P81_01210 [Wallemia ichthyophaga]TIB55344.1 hypothetical protein E3P80_01210 [Wallemia ichthyophaga]
MEISSCLQGGYHKPLSRQWQNQGKSLDKSMFMYPIFITDDPQASDEITSLPNQRRWGVNRLEGFLRPLISKGLSSVILFGVPFNMNKDGRGSAADDSNTPVIQAIHTLKRIFPDLYIACDVCLCEYTDHGHCGLLREDGALFSHESAQRIGEVALAYARAGADCVAPSDMMDGRISQIKRRLIDSGYGNRVMLMSYSAKFSTSLYGPFREAAGSAPSFGDRKCYQLPPHGRGLARRAVQRDLNEGADCVMVKPSLPYLDVISDTAQLARDYPVACYVVSGEFAMMHAGAKAGIYDLKKIAFETHESFLRAGANIFLTYFTPEFLEWL